MRRDTKTLVQIALAYSETAADISRLTGIPESTVKRTLKNLTDEQKNAAKNIRDAADRESIEDSVNLISNNILSFICAASTAINNPAKLEKASLKDIMTAIGIGLDKFPGLFKDKSDHEAGEESSAPGITIQIVDNSLDEDDKDGAQ